MITKDTTEIRYAIEALRSETGDGSQPVCGNIAMALEGHLEGDSTAAKQAFTIICDTILRTSGWVDYLESVLQARDLWYIDAGVEGPP